jgi:hypothetical protein
MKTLKTRRAWSEVFWAPSENNFSSGILYPAKLIQNWQSPGSLLLGHPRPQFQVGWLDLHSTGPPPYRPRPCSTGLLDVCSAGPPPHRPTGPPLHQAPVTQACWISTLLSPRPAGLPDPCSAGLLDSCFTRPLHSRPARSSLCQASTLQVCWAPVCPLPAIGGLQTCLRRHRQTGLGAKGVTPEQLRLQFYCSRTSDFSFFFFAFL